MIWSLLFLKSGAWIFFLTKSDFGTNVKRHWIWKSVAGIFFLTAVTLDTLCVVTRSQPWAQNCSNNDTLTERKRKHEILDTWINQFTLDGARCGIRHAGSWLTPRVNCDWLVNCGRGWAAPNEIQRICAVLSVRVRLQRGLPHISQTCCARRHQGALGARSANNLITLNSLCCRRGSADVRINWRWKPASRF